MTRVDHAVGYKIWGMITFFLVSMLGLIPIYIKDFKTNKQFISLMSCFSAGLFLAVGLMHILPSANNDFAAYLESLEHDNWPKGVDKETHLYPYAEMVTIISFSLILLLDKVIPEQSDHHDLHCDAPHEHEMQDMNKSNNNSQQQQEQYQNLVVKELSADELKRGYMSCVLFLVALSIHSILECLVLGVCKSATQGLILFLVILGHKWMGGLSQAAIGCRNHLPDFWNVLFVTILAITNIFGIAVGWSFNNSGPLVNGILKSLAAGTFTYIPIIELLSCEFKDNKKKFFKWCLFILGFLIISFVISCEPSTEPHKKKK